MSDTETTQSLTPDSGMQGQIEALQRQIFLLLLALVVVSCTFVFYLFCQFHFLNKDYDAMKPQAMLVIQTYYKNRQAISAFHEELSTYAYAHPGFQPVLKKYGWPAPKTGQPPQQPQ